MRRYAYRLISRADRTGELYGRIQVTAMEQDAFADGINDDLRLQPQNLARAAGVFAPQAPTEFGGFRVEFETLTMVLEALATARRVRLQ